MTMKIGDTVNIIKYGGGHWKGKITNIVDRYNDSLIYPTRVVQVDGGNGISSATMDETNFEFKDGEWWEVRL